jgi:Protein of unknown function (DUF3592)
MRRYSMSDRDALGKIRPGNHSDWHQIRVISGYLALAAVSVAVIFFLKHRHREAVEQNWKCAMATIEDVQPKVVEQVNSSRGGAMLYEVAILARYQSDKGEQRRWITIEQRPEPLADAELQSFRWKGQQCVVRWNPSMPEQVIAEVD